MLNKRDFMMGAASALLVSPVLAGKRSDCMAASTPLAGAQSWLPYLQQAFELEGAAGSGTLMLGSLLAAGNAEAGQFTEQFSLGFVSEASAHLASGVYTLRHASGRSVTLYLSAVGPTGMRADFNLLA